jgi:hypothetical protein
MHDRSRKQPATQDAGEASVEDAEPARAAAADEGGGKDPIAAELGRRGGRKGGRARALSLSPEQRRDIARRAAAARWRHRAGANGAEPAARHRLHTAAVVAARGTIEAGRDRLEVFVLEDGRRTVSLRSVTAALGEAASQLLAAAEDEVVTFQLPGDWRLTRSLPIESLLAACRGSIERAFEPADGSAVGHRPGAERALAILAAMALAGLAAAIDRMTTPVGELIPV